jgi:hypothetical protein
MKSKQEFGLTQQSNHCHSSRRKEAVSEIQSDLENRVYHDKRTNKFF